MACGSSAGSTSPTTGPPGPRPCARGRTPSSTRRGWRRPARVLMLTGARSFGHCFNPLSVYWCYDADGRQTHVVAEVHNTYRGRHAYLLEPDDGRLRTPWTSSSTSRPSSPPRGGTGCGSRHRRTGSTIVIALELGGRVPFTATLHGRRTGPLIAGRCCAARSPSCGWPALIRFAGHPALAAQAAGAAPDRHPDIERAAARQPGGTSHERVNRWSAAGSGSPAPRPGSAPHWPTSSPTAVRWWPSRPAGPSDLDAGGGRPDVGGTGRRHRHRRDAGRRRRRPRRTGRHRHGGAQCRHLAAVAARRPRHRRGSSAISTST